MVSRLFLLALIAGIFLSACAHQTVTERADYAEIYSPAMQRTMRYAVYTPPGWSPHESLPLVVLLHGARDNHESFDHHAVGQFLDPLIQKKQIPRAIIVIPEGEMGFWENWHDGTKHYRDWVIKDLVPKVSQNYNTRPCPQFCHVTGISMGAHGAMRFAYYSPDQFASVAAISGQIISKAQAQKNTLRMMLIKLFIPMKRIWGDIDKDNSHVPKDLDPYVSWVSRSELRNTRLLLAWGDRDYKSIVDSNTRFQTHLEANGRPHQWFVYSGRHKWTDWKPVIAESLRFHIDGRVDCCEPNSEANRKK